MQKFYAYFVINYKDKTTYRSMPLQLVIFEDEKKSHTLLLKTIEKQLMTNR